MLFCSPLRLKGTALPKNKGGHACMLSKHGENVRSLMQLPSWYKKHWSVYALSALQLVKPEATLSNITVTPAQNKISAWLLLRLNPLSNFGNLNHTTVHGTRPSTHDTRAKKYPYRMWSVSHRWNEKNPFYFIFTIDQLFQETAGMQHRNSGFVNWNKATFVENTKLKKLHKEDIFKQMKTSQFQLTTENWIWSFS